MDKSLQEMLDSTEFVVEATHEEFMGLFRQFATDSMFKTELNTYNFEHISQGHAIQVGRIKKFPIIMSIMWQRINGVLVMFYEGCSLVVHHGMLKDWIKKNVKCMNISGQIRHCNSANTHHLLNFIREKNKSLVKN